MEDLRIDLDSAVQSSTSDSPHDSTTPTSYQSSPSIKSTYKLTVRNLSYSLPPKCNISVSCNYQKLKTSNNRNVLRSVSFRACSSEILAVVGPSGAGKSTLLRVISGRIRNSNFDPNSIRLNDQCITNPSQLRTICGFVTQEDNLLPLLTVKETLMFSAKFRLKGLSSREKEERVEGLMQELGLSNVANSYIGDEDTRGVSGGERKRVSIGVDVIHDPPILLLDEPTSGLDSTSALQVIGMLASMARARRQIVILSIHQPGYRILGYISTFLLLSRGSVAYYGSLRSLEDTILQFGSKIPAQLNALEFAMEIIQDLEDWNANRSMLSDSCTKSQKGREARNIEEFEGAGETYQGYSSRISEIAALSWRFWKIIYRTKQLFLARTIQAIVSGLALGSVYLNVKTNQDGVSERLGFFAFTLSYLLSSTVEALPIFLQERRVIMRETSRKMYRLSSYMLAGTIVFVPFLLVVAVLFAVPVYWLVGLNHSLGAFSFFVLVIWLIILMANSLVLFLSAVSPDFILANTLICLFLGLFFLFSGYFITKDSIPKYWLFMYYFSIYRYPLDAMLINEYWSIRERCFSWGFDGGISSECLLTGEDVLMARGLDKDTRWFNVGVMCAFFLVYRILCWIVLVRKASKTML